MVLFSSGASGAAFAGLYPNIVAISSHSANQMVWRRYWSRSWLREQGAVFPEISARSSWALLYTAPLCSALLR